MKRKKRTGIMKNNRETRTSRLSEKKIPFYKKWWVWIIVLIVAVFISFNLGVDTAVNKQEEVIQGNKEDNDNNINQDIDNQTNADDELHTDGNNDKENKNKDEDKEESNLLDSYNVHEIDYARILLMLDYPRVNPENPIIYVNKIDADTPIFTDGKITYPEDVVSLRTDNEIYSNHDIISVAFSMNGKGDITVYHQPSEFELMKSTEPNYLDKLAEGLLDSAEDMYIDPSTPEKVAEFIDEVEFDYVN